MSGLANLDSRYVSSIDLENYFVSNQNGEALAGGIVTFYEDTNRTTQKLVYELTQDPNTGVYSYTALPNPLTLSGVGTFQDAGGNNIAVYYYPYDQFGNVQLYYITVYDAFGNLQFTREAWPFPDGGTGGGSASTGSIGLTNQLSNPQFAQINFVSPLSLTISGASTTTIPIAPDWSLTIITTGASTLVVTQNAIVGQLRLPYNPPFTLTVAYGANVSSCKLIQTLSHNPDWAAPQTAGVIGYLSGSLLLANNTSINMQYVPSVGTTQTILNVTNTTGAYAQENATIQLDAANNTDNGNTGYDQIVINLLSATSTISNVQVIPLTANTSGIQYDQTPVNRQIDHLFNYYNDLLQYKPIPSWLIGWDFPLNPAQALGSSVAAQAVGANKSYYAWDQTIIFQTANSGVTVSRDASGALKTLSAAVAGTQLALVQYLPAAEAIEMLSRPKCCMVSAIASVATTATISLWYTKDANLPSTIASNNSIVLTLDADGYPATQNGTWVKVSRNNLSDNSTTSTATNSAKFTIGTGDNVSFNQYSFAGWDLSGTADTANATYFAIVVGTASMAQNAYILWQAITCQDGSIATLPAPKSISETLEDCQRYFKMSFSLGTTPATAVGAGHGESYYISGTSFAQSTTNTISEHWSSPMYAVPTTITFYDPINASNTIYDVSTTTSCTIFGSYVNQRGFYCSFDQDAGAHQSGIFSLNYTVDARLGQ